MFKFDRVVIFTPFPPKKMIAMRSSECLDGAAFVLLFLGSIELTTILNAIATTYTRRLE